MTRACIRVSFAQKRTLQKYQINEIKKLKHGVVLAMLRVHIARTVSWAYAYYADVFQDYFHCRVETQTKLEHTHKIWPFFIK